MTKLHARADTNTHMHVHMYLHTYIHNQQPHIW